MAGLYPGPFFPGPVPAITTAALTACLNGTVGDVINLRQNGANGDFSTDDYIGFKFEVVTSGLPLGVGVYEYKIGTGVPFNDGPSANAGPDQTVVLGAAVTLDGTASSDVDGDTLTYAWSQSSGPTVTLSSTSVAQPTFTAPTLAVGGADATLVFDLTVNDGTVTSLADTVTVTVQAPVVIAPAAPTNLVATAGDGSVSLAFAAPTNTGGSAVIDYEYQLDGGSWVSAGTTASPITISGLNNGVSYIITLRAVNAAGAGTASAAISVDMPSPASAFAENQADIRQVVVYGASRSLRSTLTANQRMSQQARDRFIDRLAQTSNNASGLVSRNNIPLDVDGAFRQSGATLSTNGTFFGQESDEEGTYRRLFFGDFDVQHDADTDSTTATLSARVAWERLATDNTMLGYFVGSELATSNISGAFVGDQDRVAVTIGGYAIHQLADELYLDGFLSYGIGRNDLEMANDVLALTSDYSTGTATLGAALSGIYSYSQYELRPELAFSYGQTWIGDVGFTGRAYGLVDDTLSMDAGNVSIANLTLRPELIWAVDADTVANSNAKISFAPRAICERTTTTTRTEHCGAGAELGLSSSSDDGLSNAGFRVIMDRVGSSNRSSFALNLEHRF